MIPRYTRPEMAVVWSDENRFTQWLRIEIAVAEGMAKRGEVPEDAVRVIRERARFDIERIARIEEETRHDVIAFLECVEESVGPEARWLHLGLTSSDLLDTTLALQIGEGGAILTAECDRLISTLCEKAVAFRNLPAIGRTHGMYAEPITYGIRFARWKLEIERGRKRLLHALSGTRVGKLSGAVGTFAHNPPELEEEVLASLGLSPEPVASQIVHRDRHAALLTAIALLGASIENIATEIRGLQRSDVGEVEEPFGKKQKGSSAMPHKRNPILSENLVGLARLLRGYALTAMENVALWHERDISHSSAERVILPDAFIILDFSLSRLNGIIRGLRVMENRVAENLRRARNGFAAQALLLALARKGLSRKEAYGLVQERAHRASDEALDLEEMLLKDGQVREHLSESDIRNAFRIKMHLKHVDALFLRAGITG